MTYDLMATGEVTSIVGQLESVREWTSPEFEELYVARGKSEALKRLVRDDIQEAQRQYDGAIQNSDVDTALELEKKLTSLRSVYSAVNSQSVQVPKEIGDPVVNKARDAALPVRMAVRSHNPGKLVNQRFASRFDDQWAIQHAYPSEKLAVRELAQLEKKVNRYLADLSDWSEESNISDALTYIQRGKTIMDRAPEMMEESKRVKALVDAANEEYLSKPPYLVS